MAKKKVKKPKKPSNPYMKSMALNNPHQNVQPKSNNLPGFNFPGAVY
jgi:hypothetical protein